MMRRQVPQEHSHDATITNEFRNCVSSDVLKANGFQGNADVIFGMLGQKAAGTVAKNGDVAECVQQEIADLAITRVKAGEAPKSCLALAMMYRTLERNTNAVGEKSLECPRPPKNQELATLKQHQDPAATGQPEINRQVEINLAKALASIGEDPLNAKLTATFAPGQIGDPTAKGNSCNPGVEDPIGCEVGKLIPAASDAELLEAAGNAGNGAGAGNPNVEQPGNAGNGTDNTGNTGKQGLQQVIQDLEAALTQLQAFAKSV